jgi:hypothetical protein
MIRKLELERFPGLWRPDCSDDEIIDYRSRPCHSAFVRKADSGIA